MPPTNEPKHQHARKASPARRKSKPKFEVPAETTTSDAAAAWVYGADDVPVAPPIETKAEAIETSKSHPFLIAGMGVFFIGVGTMGLLSLAAMGLMIAPVRMGRNMFSS